MQDSSADSAVDRSWLLPFDLMGDMLLSMAQLRATGLEARNRVTALLEETFIRLVARLNPGLVLEIGAHEATFSRRIKGALPAARVVAFEANPDVHALHAAKGRMRSIEYHKLCLSDRPGTVQFQVPTVDGKTATTMGSMLAGIKFPGGAVYEVEATTADDFLGDGAGLPNAIWLDVEGALGRVLAGAERTLGSCVALYAEMETVPRWAGQHIDAEIIRVLQGHGLHMVLRDCARPTQYNGLFLRREAMAEPVVLQLCRKMARDLIAPATVETSAQTGAAQPSTSST